MMLVGTILIVIAFALFGLVIWLIHYVNEKYIRGGGNQQGESRLKDVKPAVEDQTGVFANNGITPPTEGRGRICMFVSLGLALLHFIFFIMLLILLEGNVAEDGTVGLYSSEVQMIDSLLNVSFVTNLGMLISWFICNRIDKEEKMHKDLYRSAYFDEKRNAEHQAKICRIVFIVSVIGYLLNLLTYTNYS